MALCLSTSDSEEYIEILNRLAVICSEFLVEEVPKFFHGTIPFIPPSSASGPLASDTYPNAILPLVQRTMCSGFGLCQLTEQLNIPHM